ncbi:PREDICTED: uncharacterized protein PF11_0207-like [Vollenhovia emeryi]|uniref:uncharacterized protein PF11_0207-like n=1 Tax=Vollenhovia emeryi TaxID=411798 RepID=UPI0005F3AD32|nr:PREDICTED: uncharacterized protein PF11_0207-like [Vollenhovia emeryi]
MEENGGESQEDRIELERIKRIKEKGRSGSAGTLEEIWKRKRAELDSSGGEDIFRKSRKTVRPPKERVGEGQNSLEEVLREMMKELRREVREDSRKMIEELKEEFRERERKAREEREEIIREGRDQMRRWMEEKEEMKKHIERIERKMEEIQAKVQGSNGNGGEVNEEVKRMEGKMRGIEIRLEMEEREKRRRNIVVIGIRGGKEKVETEIKKIMKDNGIKEEGLEIKRIEEGKEGEVKLAVVRIEELEEKKRLMRERRKIGEKGIRIEDDLTWKQRRMRWKLEEIARKEKENGRRVWLRYGRIQIEEKWWRLDEEEEVLKDQEGMVGKEKGGE